MQACKLMRSRSMSKFFRYQSLSGIKFLYKGSGEWGNKSRG
ncbi:hypothetical protein GXM_02683 [Nostoc sphaeroides CCNUC1]|uniref:Uncharacterized protein n=1 Tax=Nostoc sphaeroides CCNUC1 TaxID=2653204 RepID=A0A5P8VYL0_9NOSO|nr:hypothetical protein GXM_02683 [Nostoc sphaeroides CCNUC1]